MKKNTFVKLGFLAVTGLLLSATIRKSSSGAPASHTGAPGEQTCATVGCHDDNRINSGTAQLDLQLDENTSTVHPGHTYALKVKISDPGVSRFGFQLLALESKTQRDVGTFQISDSSRTQLVSNPHQLKDRRYITYTFDGTDAVSEGYGEWTIKWTAPTDLKKSVNFYLAAVSGNDDMSDKGDKVYTKRFTFKAAHE